jgi:hypothetical protein
VGGVALYKGVTIEKIRRALGSTVRMLEELALVVDGTALPPVQPQLPTGQFLLKAVFLSGACIVCVLMETYLEFLQEAQLFLMLCQMMTSIEGIFSLLVTLT